LLRYFFLFYFRARQSLADVCHQISLAKLPPPQISFTGLSHFNNTVLYIDPVKDAHLDVLTRIAGMIISIFQSHLIIHSQKFVEKFMRKMVL
jgi:hypothetical protein